ncbi:MAG: hypothetical protein ACJ8CR_33395 [Roseiflexaceae bacterium]
MNNRRSVFIVDRLSFIVMDLLWLGYDDLAVRYVDIVAVLLYRPGLDVRIVGDYGRVPVNVRAVVVTSDGLFWPSSWHAEQIRRNWSRWRDRREDADSG